MATFSGNYTKLGNRWLAQNKDGSTKYFNSESQARSFSRTGGSSSGSSNNSTRSSSPTSNPSTPSRSNSSYTGSSIEDYLRSVGQPYSYSARSQLAKDYGISNYRGSASQNTQLLNMLRSGSQPSSGSSNATNSSNNSGGMSLRDLSVGMSQGDITSQDDVNNYNRTNRGTTSTESQYQEPGSSYSGGLYNMSDYGLVRFSGTGPAGTMSDQVVWLVDPNNQTLRPFENDRALRNFFDGEVDVESITTLPASELAEGGQFGPQNGGAGFQVLSRDYAIKRDGSARKLDFSNAQLQSRYGNPVNTELEETMFSALKGTFNMLEAAGVSPQTINKIKKSDAQMAFYVSALAYGGYGIGDIYSDVKKRELGIDDLTPISANATKADYVNTNEYQEAASDNKIAPPPSIGSLNGADLDLPVYQLPDEAFQTLIPILDHDSQEFKDAMEAVETSYYDVLEQQLNASTEQDKAIADYNFQEWKKDVENQLGIQLSNNALEAWNQVEQARDQFGQRGIQGSGLQNEAVDDYLRRVRRDDQLMRDRAMDKEEKKRMNYYLSAASPEQINELIGNEPDLAQRWGLVPSEEVKEKLTLSNLKKEYPNAKEGDLAQYISILLDENGNYRSNLYQKQMGNLLDLNPGSANMNTRTGIDTAREQFQRGEVYRKSLLDEEEAYKQYTTPDTAFLRTAPDDDMIRDVVGSSNFKTTDLSSILNKAKNNLYGEQGSTGKVPSQTQNNTGSNATQNSSTGTPLSQITNKQRKSMWSQLQKASSDLKEMQSRLGNQGPTNQAQTYESKSDTSVNNSLRNPQAASGGQSLIGGGQRSAMLPNQSVYNPKSKYGNKDTIIRKPRAGEGTGTSGKGLVSKLWSKTPWGQ